MFRLTRIKRCSVPESRNFLEGIGKDLGIRQLDDWYSITREDLVKKGGTEHLEKNENYVSKFITTAFPEHPWQPWKFTGDKWWEVPQNQRSYLDFVGKELGVNTIEDWYNIHVEDLQKKGGVLLPVFGNNLMWMLKGVYTDHTWINWKFTKLQRPPWQVGESQEGYLNLLGKELGVKKMDDWYKITAESIKRKGGHSILSKFGGSGSKMLQAVFSTHKWLPWKFAKLPVGWIDKIENQKWYMEWLGGELGYKTMDDWYALTEDDFMKRGGSTLINRFELSPPKLITHVYPNHDWLPWKFRVVPKGWWLSHENNRTFLDWLGKLLNIKTMEDWYKVPSDDIVKNYGATLILKNRNPFGMLRDVYPEYKWELEKFVHPQSP